MRLMGLMGLGAALALASTSALAFQEQQSGGAVPAPAAPAAAAPAAAPDSKAVELSTPSATDGGAGAGTEVRIPGLGKLGVLPKMDFGLELLYGANEAKRPDAVETETPDDDLTVRGTIKHNF